MKIFRFFDFEEIFFASFRYCDIFPIVPDQVGEFLTSGGNGRFPTDTDAVVV